MTITKSIKKRWKTQRLQRTVSYPQWVPSCWIHSLIKSSAAKASHSQPPSRPSPSLTSNAEHPLQRTYLLLPPRKHPDLTFFSLPLATRPYIPSPGRHHQNNLLITSRAYTFSPRYPSIKQARESTRAASVNTIKRTLSYGNTVYTLFYSHTHTHTQKNTLSLISRPLCLY